MTLSQPISFLPLFMERVWGARNLESLYHKPLPPGAPIGESWELVDREEAQSVVRDGALAGKTLHELWVHHRAEIFGDVKDAPQFPLLFKLLDCADVLSVQVHPPAAIAAQFGGEPKTEMWFIAHTFKGSEMFVGLKNGATREGFEKALRDGTVAECLHRIPSRPGDAVFIPSGRIHALGAGNILFEVQQNSDTTYRVFDWNRTGLDGKPRALHVEQSLASIDFEDSEPPLAIRDGEVVLSCEYFCVEQWKLDAPRRGAAPGRFAIFTVLSGRVGCAGAEFPPGEFFVLPASLKDREVKPLANGTTLLRTTLPP